jgi:hypothetical protein
MIRWNDVIGRPSHIPNRVRGSPLTGVSFASFAVSAGSGLTLSPVLLERRSRDRTAVSKPASGNSHKSQV